MITFLEQRINPKITQGAQGGPTVSNRQKVYLPSGRLIQSFGSTAPIHRYDVSHGVRNRAEFQSILDLFYIVMFTPYLGFRFKDWRDFQGTRDNTKLTKISGTDWQLQRRHVFGGIEFLRDIIKPVSGTVKVFDAAGTLLPAAIDYTTGVATVSGAPATWAGEFDIPVTFTDDEWTSDLEIANYSEAWVTSHPIKLEEVRP